MLKPFIVLLLAAACGVSAEPLRFSSGSARTALVELYTSEGCSSCPPADQWLAALAGQAGLWKDFVPVAFHVNYWDSLGWKDRLSSPEFTARQYAYSAAWGSPNVYTPCFVRNGAEWKPLGGSLPGASGQAGVLSVEVGDDGSCRAVYLPGPGSDRDPYEVHVALLGGGLASKVTAGENDGRTLRHDFVVLGLAKSEMVPGIPGAGVRAQLTVPKPIAADSKRLALAAWVVRRGDMAPVQATGGWLR
jgi:hypothetical protein